MSSQPPVVMPVLQPSFRPYLITAVIDWYESEGYTPYMAAQVSDACRVPREYVNEDNSIVLCVANQAVNQWEIDADGISFQARFGMDVHSLWIPMSCIVAIFPKENQELGTFFPIEKSEEIDEPTFTKLT